MNDADSKKQETSAISIIADAAAQLMSNSSTLKFHNPLQTLSSHVPNNAIFDSGNALSRQIDPNGSVISGGGIPLKKRKTSGAVVVNSSDMEAAPKKSLTLPSSLDQSMTISYPQSSKSLVQTMSGPSLDILSTSNTNSVIASAILDQIPNKKNGYLGSSTSATPATPIGQVVESGQEQTGRWTREEHEAFLAALQKYGKEWKKVAAKVKTRTVVQTRTHAQKYFQKLQKAMAGGNDVNNSAVDAMMMMAKDDDNNNSDVNLSSLSKKRTPSHKTSQRRNGLPSLSKLMREQEQAEATAAAAQLMAQMSSTVLLHNKKPTSSFTPSETTSSTPFYSFSNNHPNIKITAPTHEQVNERINKFGYPEPSPAACGKRKLAEIAAAQMLAGVANSGKKPPNTSILNSSLPHTTNSMQPYETPTTQSTNGTMKKSYSSSSLQIVNPDNLAGDSFGGKKRQRWMMGNSPTTPWEDQLEALVNQFKNKEKRSYSETSSSTASSNFSNMVDALLPLQPQPSHSALHTAVISSDVNQVAQLLKLISASSSSLKPNLNGYTPLHSATCLKTNALEITRLILSVGADVMERDREGNTALHWAVRGGNSDVAHVLIIRNCLLDAPNEKGETPLHWAMRAGPEAAVVVRTLLADGAKPHVFSKKYQRPLDVAALGFNSDSTSKDMKRVIETRKNFFLNSPQSRTLILHHPECLGHIPKSANDWEVPDRVESILKLIEYEEGNLFHKREIAISSDFDRASLELLSRVHSAEYLAFVNNLSKELERRQKENADSMDEEKKQPVIPFTPTIQRTFMKDDNVEIGNHSDTSFSAGSLKAARRAAGAVQHSVDCVLMGRNSNAFCIVRPPGHHAGYNGLLNDSESSGFCIFNNIAAGALHALSDRHRSRCERCAILDIDVHHGNGTEDIVRKINDPERILFFSVHLFDQDQQSMKKSKKNGDSEETKNNSSAWKFYPGTGEGDDVAHNVINVPIAPLWREKDFIDCVSSSFSQTVPQNPYNTRNKQKQKVAAAAKANKKEGSDELSKEDSKSGGCNGSIITDAEVQSSSIKQNGEHPKSETCNGGKSSTLVDSPPTTPTPSEFLIGTGRRAYRRAIQHRLIPALRAFNPDLILISAGFDAAKEDVGNAKHMAGGKVRMGIDLEPEDYAWTTRRIMEVADICCQGRVVSVLEGGYGRMPSSADEHLLDKSIFSQCASMHLSAMIDPHNKESRQSRDCHESSSSTTTTTTTTTTIVDPV